MKNSISLIGMAGAGKSSVGKMLATELNLEFKDSDIIIESHYRKSLQEILNQQGYLKLREIEDLVIRSIPMDSVVLSTGGSAVYSKAAMQYIQQHSNVFYLQVPFNLIIERVPSFSDRGFAKKPEQTIEEAFYEREILYKQYSTYSIDNSAKIEECVASIIDLI